MKSLLPPPSRKNRYSLLAICLVVLCSFTDCFDVKTTHTYTHTTIKKTTSTRPGRSTPVNVSMTVEKEEKAGAFPEFTITLTNNGSEVADGLYFQARTIFAQDVNRKDVTIRALDIGDEDGILNGGRVSANNITISSPSISSDLKSLNPGESGQLKIKLKNSDIVHGTIGVVLRDGILQKDLALESLTTENGLTFKVRDIKPERNEDKNWEFEYALEIINHTDEAINLQGINIALEFPGLVNTNLEIEEPTLVRPCLVFTYNYGIEFTNINADAIRIKDSYDGSLTVKRGNETLADVAQKDVKVLLKTPASDQDIEFAILPALHEIQKNILQVNIDLKNLTQEVINLEGVKISYELKSPASSFSHSFSRTLSSEILDKRCIRSIPFPLNFGNSKTQKWVQEQEFQLTVTVKNKEGKEIASETKPLSIKNSTAKIDEQ